MIAKTIQSRAVVAWEAKRARHI